MTLSLTLEQQRLIKGQVASGRFHDADEVVAAALELLEENSASEPAVLEAAVLEGCRDHHVPYGEATLARVRAAGKSSQ